MVQRPYGNSKSGAIHLLRVRLHILCAQQKMQ